MSADNGNYFCSFPTSNGGTEVYVVWNGSDSFLNDLQDPTVCGGERYVEFFNEFFFGAQGPLSAEEVQDIKQRIDDGWTEYGNCDVTFDHHFDQPHQEFKPYVFPDNACPHCSTRYSHSYHQPDTCERNPENPKFILQKALGEQYKGGILNVAALVNSVFYILYDAGFEVTKR